MEDLRAGYLFKKRKVFFKKEKYEVFEVVDYVCGIFFTNLRGVAKINVINGKYKGIYAQDLTSNFDDEFQFGFLNDNLKTAIKDNNGVVNFEQIQSAKISLTAKYYKRISPTQLEAIKDKDLIAYLENNKNEKEESSKYEDTKGQDKGASDITYMYNQIRKTIISQDEQIKQILTTIYKNQKVINSDFDLELISRLKENILVYGPTGTGKTEILKRISKLYSVPIVIEDATSLSETGYKGRNVSNMLEDLYLEAGKDLNLAQRGILVIDEFDKLAENDSSSEAHVSRLGVQRSLLKLLDGSSFYLDDSFNNLKFETSKLTIVGLGAFTNITNDDNYKFLTMDDFTRYGIIRELMGRFSKTVAMNSLTKDDIIKILKISDSSPIYTYEKLFALLNIAFDYSDDFFEYIAMIAISKKSGARSLKTVFDNCISGALFKIFSGEYMGISLVKPTENNPDAYILKRKRS